jgi:bifunctional DNA-binding transcriptional regulator/antitoxin component of YhaV-PrlF toxin-antitoxin module
MPQLDPATGPAEARTAGWTQIWGKRRVTLPAKALELARLALGDRLVVEVSSESCITLRRVQPTQTQHHQAKLVG